MSKPSGFTLYDGPSAIDGARIVAIATVSRTKNPKTGDMVQTWILRADQSPMDATRSGADASVCGDCMHRPANAGTCYVSTFRAPLQVWRKWKRGGYPHVRSRIDGQHSPDALASIGAGRMVRLGAYGDPAAVPAYIWEWLTRDASGRTGYTHQWLSPAIGKDQRERITRLCMASADNATEADMARSIGLRTFRVRTPNEPLREREFTCPASDEAGKRKTCATCGACNGSAKPSAASIVIIVHGTRTKQFTLQGSLL